MLYKSQIKLTQLILDRNIWRCESMHVIKHHKLYTTWGNFTNFGLKRQVRIQDLVGGGGPRQFIWEMAMSQITRVRVKGANIIGRGPGPALGPWKLLHF